MYVLLLICLYLNLICYKTLSLNDFSNQKEQIEKEIADIVNKELNSANLSEHAILWLKLGDLNIYQI